MELIGLIIILIIIFTIDNFQTQKKNEEKKREELQKKQVDERLLKLKEINELKIEKERDRKLKEEEEIQNRLRIQRRIEFLKAKKPLLYNYGKDELISFIKENKKDWKYCFTYLSEKSKAGHGITLDVYDSKNFYIEEHFEDNNYTGHTDLVDKITGEKTKYVI